MILKIIDGSYNPQNPVGPTELVLVEHVFILRLFHLSQMLQIEFLVNFTKSENFAVFLRFD